LDFQVERLPVPPNLDGDGFLAVGRLEVGELIQRGVGVAEQHVAGPQASAPTLPSDPYSFCCSAGNAATRRSAAA
jgi:hypothetical protein